MRFNFAFAILCFRAEGILCVDIEGENSDDPITVCYCEHKNGQTPNNGIMCGYDGGVFSIHAHCSSDESCVGPTEEDDPSIRIPSSLKAELCANSNDIDECQSQPCQNGGTCVGDIDSYNCNCLQFYTGRNCEIDIVNCQSQPCQNGGTCVGDIDFYHCNCLPDYTGQNCEIDSHPCRSDPCQHGGLCTDEFGYSELVDDFVYSYMCECVSGFTGPNCETVDCEEGWQKFENSCYKIDGMKNWDQAEQDCIANGAHLASILSPEENDFVTALNNKKEYFWIGGMRDGRNSEFKWIDGSAFNNQNWKKGEPNSFGSKQCIKVYSAPGKKYHKQWYDSSCGSRLFYVCKK